MSVLHDLRDKIEKLHNCVATHSFSIDVTEEHNGKIVWDGVVEVFKIKNHSDSDTCYAWSFDDQEGNNQYVTVFKIPPVNSPEMAVRAYILDYFNRSET